MQDQVAKASRCGAALASAWVVLIAGCATPTDGAKPATGEDKSLGQTIAAINPFQSPGQSAKPLIASLAPGAYDASPLAVGEQKDLARQRGKSLGFVRQPDLETQLNAIRKKLLAGSGVIGVPGRVSILANPAFAASSSPDGNIAIAMGWMPFLENEDEVAAIIAHEQSHVLRHHHSSDLMGDMQKRAQSLQEIGFNLRDSMQAPDAAKSKSEDKSLLATQAVVGVTDKLVMPAFGRRQETEADLMGIDLLVKAGYSPVAMTTMLEKQRQWEKQTQDSDDLYWKRVNEVAATDISKAMSMAFKHGLESVSASHPDTSARIDDAAAYIDKFYSDKANGAMKQRPWTELRARPAVKSMITAYEQAFSARKLLEAGKLSDAYKAAKLSVSGVAANDAYPNWIFSKTATASGRNTEAIAALRRALNSSSPVLEIYTDLSAQLEARNDNAGALALIDKADTIFGEPETLVPTRIRLLRKLGRTKEASALALKCSVDTPTQRSACQEAANIDLKKKTK